MICGQIGPAINGKGVWPVVLVYSGGGSSSQPASQSRETFHRNVGGLAAAYNKISNRNKHRRPQQTSSLSLSAILLRALVVAGRLFPLFHRPAGVISQFRCNRRPQSLSVPLGAERDAGAISRRMCTRNVSKRSRAFSTVYDTQRSRRGEI